MINLIPPQAKRSLRKEYWIRVISVWLLLWSTALVVGTFILLPVYVLIGSQINAYEDSAAEASLRVNEYENVSAQLIQASKQAKSALEETKYPFFSDYITQFQNLEGDEIQIYSINIVRSEDGFDPIKVTGIAVGRQSLATFRDRIVALEEVMSVDFPISNLAQDKDIPFSITITLNKEKAV